MFDLFKKYKYAERWKWVMEIKFINGDVQKLYYQKESFPADFSEFEYWYRATKGQRYRLDYKEGFISVDRNNILYLKAELVKYYEKQIKEK
jgi:hypothetical protein